MTLHEAYKYVLPSYTNVAQYCEQSIFFLLLAFESQKPHFKNKYEH